MVPAVTRVNHYNARMQSTLVDPVLVAVNANALTNYAVFVAEFVPLQIAMRAILSSEGIPTMLWGAYEAMNGEFYKASKTSEGDTESKRFSEIVDKWVARGVDEDVAVAIALQVYSVSYISTP